jgi:hypothetical protein
VVDVGRGMGPVYRECGGLRIQFPAKKDPALDPTVPKFVSIR